MNIQLCNKALQRLAAAGIEMVSTLRDDAHTVSVKDCLTRCQGCERGLVIANVDGMPVSPENAAALLALVAELAADED